MFRRVITWGLIGCAFLSGCASLPSSTPPAATSERWQGRFSAVTESVAGLTDESAKRNNVTGRFELSQQTNLTTLELASPLGQLVARLTISPGQARLETADRGEFTASDIDTLTEKVLGWKLPLTNLPSWLRGNTGSNSQLGSTGRLLSAQEAGWDLNIEEHSESGKPSRLLLEWPNKTVQPKIPYNQIRLRLILDKPSLTNP